MGKALVIQGVDFSVNKLDTVILSDPIPCTGLVLSQSAIAITKVGNTATLTATVTPSNTTDPVYWSSSDNNIASVNNGVITTKGVGTVIITVTCGTQTAACTVTSTAVYNESDLAVNKEFGTVRNSSTTDAMKVQGQAAYATYNLLNNATGGYQTAINAESQLGHIVYPIPIPYNAKSLEVTLPDKDAGTFNGFYMYFLNSKSNQSFSENIQAATYVKSVTLTASTNPSITPLTSVSINLEEELANTSGVDSITLSLRGTNTTEYAPSTWDRELVLSFS